MDIFVKLQINAQRSYKSNFFQFVFVTGHMVFKPQTVCYFVVSFVLYTK
jgi:hypothetical protein